MTNQNATILLRSVRILHPGEGIDRTADMLIRDGAIAEIGESLDAREGIVLLNSGVDWLIGSPARDKSHKRPSSIFSYC